MGHIHRSTVARLPKGLLVLSLLLAFAQVRGDEQLTMSGVMAAAGPADWRQPEAANTLYMQLPQGLVVFELAPQFAPATIANIRVLVEQQFFDGLAIVRSQDNYVVQWGDPNAGTADARAQGDAADTLAPEFFLSRDGVNMTLLDSRDAYAEEVGFAGGLPAARDAGRAWLAHCYGMLGVGRAEGIASGNGAELYVVTGHAPRHLDRNVTLIGRVLHGMEHLSTLPRGSGPLGYYEHESEHVEIRTLRFGDQLEVADRLPLQVLRTDTDTFRDLVDARTNRLEHWFADPAGKIELCNVPLPVRLATPD